MSATNVLQSSPYTDRVIGFAGPTPLEITLDASGRIADVKLLPNKDTPQYLQKAIDGGLLKAWNGLTPKEALAKPVDAVTGATFSSRGIINTMHKRLEVHEAQRSSSNTTFAALSIGLAAVLVVVFFLFRRKKEQASA